MEGGICRNTAHTFMHEDPSLSRDRRNGCTKWVIRRGCGRAVYFFVSCIAKLCSMDNELNKERKKDLKIHRENNLS